MSDEAAVRDVIARIGMVRAHGTPEQYAAFFTPDATWERPPGADGKPVVSGLQEELAHARENQAARISGPGSHAYHIIPTTVVDLDGDRATATSQLLFVKNADRMPEIVKMWILRDELVRTPQGWRVRHRRFERP